MGVDPVGAEGNVKGVEKVEDFEESFAGLASGGGDDEDEGVGLGEEAVGHEYGGYCAFSPLSVAVEGGAFFEMGGFEDVFLRRFGLEFQEFFGEEEGAEDS